MFVFVTGVVIRPGLADDLEKIKVLCREVNFFEEWDFLPGLWMKYATDPNTLLVVAESNGKLVSSLNH